MVFRSVLDAVQGTIQEIPGAGERLAGTAETHQQDASSQLGPGQRKFPGQFHQHSHTGGIAVGAEVDAVHPLSVHGELVHPQVVHTCSHHYIVLVQVLIPTRDNAHHVAGRKGIGLSGQLEFTARGEHFHPVFLQFFRQVIRRHALSFRSGLPAFQLGAGPIGQMFLEGPDGFGVVQVFQRDAILRMNPSCRQQGNQQGQKFFHHSFTRIQLSWGHTPVPRS